MKMSPFLIIVLVGLALCAVWLRLSPRRAGIAATPPPVPAREDHRALNTWQGGVILGQPTDYEAETRRRLLEKLKHEEERQRPWEGRN